MTSVALKTFKGKDIMRTAIYGSEPIYAYHKIIDGKRVAICVDKNGKEVNVVFSNNKEKDKIFDYGDWLELSYYKKYEDKE